jgi:serpin B
MNHWKKILLISFMLLPMVACSEPTKPDQKQVDETLISTTKNSETETPPPPRVPVKRTGSSAIAIKDLSLDLYQQLQTTKGNLFFSPYSISSAFAMTYAGARENTQQQMAKVFHFDTLANLHSSFSELTRTLTANQSAYQLQIANALWGQKGQLFSIEFGELMQEYYGTGIKAVDFENATEQARAKINQWTADKTKKRIPQILAPGILTKQTKLVLTNAIYFLGNWEFPFNEKNTQSAPFNVSAQQTVEVPTMYQEGDFNYSENEEMQLIELPYKKGKATAGLSMLILLPKQMDGLASVERRLGTYLPQKKTLKKVAVSLPKFKVDSAFQLQEPLKKLGMTDAFDREHADFSGINGKKDLAITAVVHKAFVEIDEKGTEASAATAVVISSRGLSEKPIDFRVDHPFIFLIRDNQSGTILFLGRVINPTE